MSMEIVVSSASAIAELLHYRRTLFPLGRFLPLALFLTLAASAQDQTTTVFLALGRVFLVLPWLLQFRLADDLADRERDRQDYPDRVLVRAAPGPFLALLVLLVAGNTLLLAWLCPTPRWAEFLTLSGLLLSWYVVTRRHRPLVLIASLPVLLKYPAFVYLLSSPRTGA